MRYASILVALVVMVHGLQADDRAPGKKPTLKELKAAPRQVAIAGRPLKLETNLWRDFMPISPPDGKPLIALVTLKTADGKALPRGVTISTVWVIHGDKLWSAPVKEIEKETASCKGTARNGPKWGPGVKVDVVIAVKDEKGQSYLLRAAGQKIERTD